MQGPHHRIDSTGTEGNIKLPSASGAQDCAPGKQEGENCTLKQSVSTSKNLAVKMSLSVLEKKDWEGCKIQPAEAR